jgi:DNA-binding transcriptional regulator YiaG
MKKDRDRAKARRATPADADVGKRIQARRRELGLSQTQLGDLIGVTFQQVQKYEQGTTSSQNWALMPIRSCCISTPRTRWPP